MLFSCKTEEMMEIQAKKLCEIKGGRRPEAAAPFINHVSPYVACISIISLVLHENGMGV